MLLGRVKVHPVLPLFIVAHFSHHFAIGGLVPLLPWLRDSFQLDYFQSGLLVSSLPLISGFSQLPVASLADRWSKTRIVGIGLIGVSFGAIAMSLAPGFNVLMGVLFLVGLFASTYHAPTSSFLSQCFSQEGRGRALGTHTIGGAFSLFATPMAAVLIATYTGDWRYSFMALSIPAFLAGLLILSLGRKHEAASLEAVASAPKERIRIVEVARLIGILVMIAMVSSLVASAITSFLPLYLVDKHHMPRELAGIIPSLINAAGIVGAPLGGSLSDRFGRKPLIMLSVILTGPLVYTLTVIPPTSLTVTVPLMLAILLVYGLIWSTRFPVMESLIADTVPWHRRASVLAIYFFLSAETGAVVNPVVGLFSNSYGLEAAFSGLAIIALASSALVLLIRKQV